MGPVDNPGVLKRMFTAAFLIALGLIVGAGGKAKAAADQSPPMASCAQAGELRDLGRIPAAEKAYEKVLEAEGSSACAIAGLEGIARAGECGTGDALLGVGEKAEAKQAYLGVLKIHAGSECASSGIETASDSSHWDDLETFSEDALTVLGAAVLAVGAAAVVILLLLRLQACIPWLRNRWPVRVLRRPAVMTEPLDDSGLEKPKLGVATTALLRGRIELGADRDGIKLLSGASTTEESWIGRVSELGDQGKFVAAIVGLLVSLLPRRHVKVTGALQPASSNAPTGISLELASGGSIVLWADRFLLSTEERDFVETTRRMVVPAAAWVSHRVTRETGGTTLGAQDPISWALFKTGVEWQQDDDLHRAAQLYAEALEIDATNYGALANLGLIEAGLGRYATAIPRLREALMVLETR